MSRKNILLSTTRQWNPGDEFILFGVINILKNVIGDFNPIIYNRNPDVRPCDLKYNRLLSLPYNKMHEQMSFRGRGIVLSHFRDRFCDNSYRDGMSGDFIDYVIFAGSPEWRGERVRELYRMINKYEKPVSFLGIGYGGQVRLLNENLYKQVWQKAEIITTRDYKTYELMKRYNTSYLPCPALLSATEEKNVKEVKRIALVYAISETHSEQRVSKQTEEYLLQLYNALIQRYDCSIVCHYIGEIESARKNFPNHEILYSFNSQDYFDIYKKFDFVVGARVHAMGICASLGIPGLMVAHGVRSSTVNGFKSHIISQTEYTISQVEECLDKLVEEANICSIALKRHKYETQEKYIKLVKEHTSIGKKN